MKYRMLGKTQLRVSVIGVGTWQLGGEWGKNFAVDEVSEMLNRAYDLGINFIDTAECYGDHLSESLIGQAVSTRRKDWVIATKFGHKFESFMQRSEPRTGPEVEKQLEDSLRALRTDYVDLYQYHSVRDSEFQRDDVKRVLEKAVQAGKVLHVGASISPNTNIVQTDLATQFNVETIQVVYNRLDRAAEQAVLPSCQRQSLGVLARVPLASGHLSGKYKPGMRFGDHDVRNKLKPAELDKRLEEVARIGREEVPEGVPMAQWALAWCLKHPAVSAVIPGCKNVAQVESNAAAARLDLVSLDHPLAVL